MKTIKNCLIISLIFGIVINNTQKNNANKNPTIIIPHTPYNNQNILILEDQKILLDIEYLNKFPKNIELDLLNKDNNTLSKYKLNFYIGFSIPLSTELKNDYSYATTLSSSFDIPLTYTVLNKKINNSIFIIHARFNDNFQKNYILLNQTTNIKLFPILLSSGIGISNDSNSTHLASSIDFTLKLLKRNNLNLNFNFIGCWNSFSLIDQLFGLNIKYSRNF